MKKSSVKNLFVSSILSFLILPLFLTNLLLDFR